MHATYLNNVSPEANNVRFTLPKNDREIVKNETKRANTIVIIFKIIN